MSGEPIPVDSIAGSLAGILPPTVAEWVQEHRGGGRCPDCGAPLEVIVGGFETLERCTNARCTYSV